MHKLSAPLSLLVAGCGFTAPVNFDIDDPTVNISATGQPVAVIEQADEVQVVEVDTADAIVVVDDDMTGTLQAGTYGAFEITANDLSLAGAVHDDGDLLTIIDGDLIIRGNNVEVSSVIVTGTVIVRGNNAVISDSELEFVEIRGNNTVLADNLLHSQPAVFGNNVELIGNIVE